jgi:hypothetical protein
VRERAQGFRCSATKPIFRARRGVDLGPEAIPRSARIELLAFAPCPVENLLRVRAGALMCIAFVLGTTTRSYVQLLGSNNLVCFSRRLPSFPAA